MTDTSKQAARAATTARTLGDDAVTETRRRVRRIDGAAEAGPVLMLAGGVAIGLAVGALLPRTKSETRVLGSVGKRLNVAVSDATDAAKSAARAELGSFPLSKAEARAQVSKLFDQVGTALSAGGDAALAARDGATSGKSTRRATK